MNNPRFYALFACLLAAASSIGCGAPSEEDELGLDDGAALGETQHEVAASVCGAGYKLIDVLPLQANPGHPLPGGELEVFYNASKGMNCLVEQSLGRDYGRNKRMFVGVCLQKIRWDGSCPGGVGDFDGGDFKYYAGPVYIKAPHQCIYYSAGVYEGPTANHGGGAYGIEGKGYCN